MNYFMIFSVRIKKTAGHQSNFEFLLIILNFMESATAKSCSSPNQDDNDIASRLHFWYI